MDEIAALLGQEGDGMNVLLRIDKVLKCGCACESKPAVGDGGVCFAWGPKVRQWSERFPYFSGLREKIQKSEGCYSWRQMTCGETNDDLSRSDAEQINRTSKAGERECHGDGIRLSFCLDSSLGSTKPSRRQYADSTNQVVVRQRHVVAFSFSSTYPC